MSPGTDVIVGASGQIGRNATRSFSRRGWKVVGTGLTRATGGLVPLDLADLAGVHRLISEVRPTLCILSSALTNVDRCEQEPDLADRLNARAPEAAARACREVGAKVIYLSTEYVFDGADGPYSEADPVHPISAYGRSKLAGEVAVLSEDPENLAVRTTVVFSHHVGDKNFVMQLLDRVGRGQPMNVPADQVSSPTYAPDLAEALAMLAGRVHGVLNVAGPEVLGRYEFALRAARRLGLDAGLLTAVKTSELRQLAARPLQAGLKVDRLRSLGVEPRGLDAALDEVAGLARAVGDRPSSESGSGGA